MPLTSLVMEPVAVTEESVVQAQIDAALSQVNGPLVAKVLAYSDATQRATVQPVAQWTGTGPQPITMQPMANVPVCFGGGNGFTIVAGLAPGDIVLVVFLGRSHDEWFATAAVNAPPTDWRQHSLSDAVIIAGVSPDTAPLTTLQARPGELVIGLSSGVQIRINKAGQFRIGTVATDFLATMIDLISALQAATVNTPLGPQPLDAVTQALLVTYKDNLTAMKIP